MKEEKTPAIRFKGFTDDWEQRKLGDVAPLRGGFAFKSEQYKSSGIPIVRISNILADGSVGDDFVYYQQQTNDEIYTLKDGDAVLAMSGATTGKVSVIHAGKQDKYYQNQRVGYFTKSDAADYSFISTIVRSEQFAEQLNSVLVAGAQPNVSSKEIDVFEFMMPKSKEEQKQIGIFFTSLDRTITLHQRKYEQLQIIKKSMLENMFPKDRERIPRIRFSGFTDDWEQRKLGEMGTTFTGLSGKSKEDFGHGNAQFVTYMNVYSNPVADLSMTEHVEIDNRQAKIQYGDVFFTTSSETPEEVGMSSVWLGNTDNTYLNSFCFGYRLNVNIDPYYMAYLLRSDSVRKKLIFLAQGISRYNISKNRVMEIEIPLPRIDEQKCIGAFFKNLDNTITLHHRKLEKLKVLKQAMLQKMFV